MLIRMHHKLVENYLSAICGVFGFGISWTNMQLADAIPKIAVASFSALLAGGMGYVGKLLTAHLLRKAKLFFHHLKNRK